MQRTGRERRHFPVEFGHWGDRLRFFLLAPKQVEVLPLHELPLLLGRELLAERHHGPAGAAFPESRLVDELFDRCEQSLAKLGRGCFGHSAFLYLAVEADDVTYRRLSILVSQEIRIGEYWPNRSQEARWRVIAPFLRQL